ncbi:MAG: hypothetical protein COA73_09235 [Candidatus Hydrogenedentota bacterium]|nr:MAG: hypothetical protein COA73_09235 [Candidatus Hydrogenedentota bacterium]
MAHSDEKQVKQFLQHAEAKLLHAEFAPPEAREEIWHEVKDALIRAEKIVPGSGAWLMACLHGRQQNPEMCRKWLERAKKHGALPDGVTIQSNPHLKLFHDSDWFQIYLG